MNEEIKEKLLSLVIKQIEEDIKDDYYMSLYELLGFIPDGNLISYLQEDIQNEFNTQLN
jgi:hypothetical protein